jgi:uncharacterized protein YecT (DUF1311 family)
MAQYGTCECYFCHIRVPKPEAYQVTIERETGRSGGSFRFYSKSRSTSYSTGRTYYAKRDIWLCQNCYPIYQKRQRQRAFATVIGVGLFIGAAIWFFSSNNSPQQSSPSISVASSSPAQSIPAPHATAYYQGSPVTSPRTPGPPLDIQAPRPEARSALVPRGSVNPSFECASAVRASARLICADGDLAQLDFELGKTFGFRRRQIPTPYQADFIRSQIAWIAGRDEYCGLTGSENAPIDILAKSKPCMMREIQARITVLSQQRR